MTLLDRATAHLQTHPQDELVAGLVARIKQSDEAAWKAAAAMSEASAHAGFLEGQLEGIGWNGGVEATIDAFRKENERLRAELASTAKDYDAMETHAVLAEAERDALRAERDALLKELAPHREMDAIFNAEAIARTPEEQAKQDEQIRRTLARVAAGGADAVEDALRAELAAARGQIDELQRINADLHEENSGLRRIVESGEGSP